MHSKHLLIASRLYALSFELSCLVLDCKWHSSHTNIKVRTKSRTLSHSAGNRTTSLCSGAELKRRLRLW